MLFVVWLVLLFFIGAAVGSFLNVCISRLPLEKSILWPLGSRCGNCLQPIAWYDNLPLVSYWLLRGRCRSCGASFSIRYFLVELLTGLGFAGLFYLEVVDNIHGLPLLQQQEYFIHLGLIPWQAWVLFFYHALLFSLLMVVAVADIDHLEIPLPVTLTGTVLGLIGSMLFPWPWPNTPEQAWQHLNLLPSLRVSGPKVPRPALYPWPVWNQLPAWMPLGSWRAGLATGLAGVLAGIVILRVIAFLFKKGRGKEGLGVGDADLMMMVGAFLGWQAVIVAFFVAVAPALVLGLLQLLLRGDKPLPFGPSLAFGAVVTWLSWRWLAADPRLAILFFDGPLLIGVGLVGAVVMFVSFWMLGVVRGRDTNHEIHEAHEK